MHALIEIQGRRIGTDEPAYIIAELSANHGQSFDTAVELIRAAHEAGADAIKLQTYTADTLTIDCDREEFLIKGTVWDGQNLYNLYRQAHTPWRWQPQLKTIANQLGLTLFSTPFDHSSVEFLEQMDVPAYKIASFEIGDTSLLKRVAQTGKPVIVSTGMAEKSEIDLAMTTLLNHGASQVALLKCTSAYPVPPDSMNLRTIPDMIRTYQVPCGLSDHTLTHAAAMASVCLGGSIIEKHITLSRDDGGPDSAFSLEPTEFKRMVQAVRSIEATLGHVHYGPNSSDKSSRCFRRSLFVVKDIAAGEKFRDDNIRSIRPGQGIEPRFLEEILGKTAKSDVARGTPLAWHHVA